MYVYPLDKKDKDGKLFWSLPKRPPKALEFDTSNELHQDMIAAYACLVAVMHNVKIPHDKPRDREAKIKMAQLATEFKVEPFKLDESAIKEMQDMVDKEQQSKENTEEKSALEEEESK